MPRVTEVQPYQYALNDSSVTLALVPLSPRNRFISNLEESTNVSTRNTLSRKFSPILNIHREITHPLPAKLPWLRAVTTYLEWRIIAFDPKAISNSDLYEWRAPRDEWYYTLARSAHTCEPMYTRVHDRLHVLCRCGRRKEGARAYIYICTMVEERCVSRSIFITCLERRRGGCSSETYESQRTRMQRTIVPAFQPANRNALSTLLPNLGLRRSSCVSTLLLRSRYVNIARDWSGRGCFIT